MNIFIPNIEEAIYEAVQQVLREEMPEIIRKANRRKWLTTEEVMEMLQCSRRHIQYLRDSNQLSYSQNGRTIRYNIEDIEAFLNEGKVESKS